MLRRSGIWLYASPMDEDPLNVLLFDTSFFLLSGPRVSGSLDTIVVAGSNWVLEFKVNDAIIAKEWGVAINSVNVCNEWTRSTR